MITRVASRTHIHMYTQGAAGVGVVPYEGFNACAETLRGVAHSLLGKCVGCMCKGVCVYWCVADWVSKDKYRPIFLMHTKPLISLSNFKQNGNEQRAAGAARPHQRPPRWCHG